MATVSRRGAKWQARVRRRGVSRSATFRTRREAERWAAQMEQDAERGVSGSSLPFRAALVRYRDEVSAKRDGGRPEMLRINSIIGDGARDADPLADIPMNELSARHFADWRDRRLADVSPATVNREWNLLSSVCSRCVREWGWMADHPMRGVQRPKQPPPRTRRVSDDEIQRIIVAAGWSEDVPPYQATMRVVDAFLFAIETAMRAGEICALRHDDVDLSRRVARVRAEDLGARKTGHARDVPLSSRAVEIVRHVMRADHGEDRLFGLSAKRLDALWRKLRDRAAIEGLHFHDTRAEALTRLSRKLDVMQLARVSGHRDLRLLLNTYYRERAEALVDLLD